MPYGFNPGELVATRVEKASEYPEIYVRSVRKFALSPTDLVLDPNIRKCDAEKLGLRLLFG